MNAIVLTNVIDMMLKVTMVIFSMANCGRKSACIIRLSSVNSEEVPLISIYIYWFLSGMTETNLHNCHQCQLIVIYITKYHGQHYQKPFDDLQSPVSNPLSVFNRILSDMCVSSESVES